MKRKFKFLSVLLAAVLLFSLSINIFGIKQGKEVTHAATTYPPSVGTSEWGTVTITDSKLYQYSSSPAAPDLIDALHNAGLLSSSQLYVTVFGVRLSGFSGDLEWLNGRSFNTVGSAAIYGDISSHIRCLDPHKADPNTGEKASIEVKVTSVVRQSGSNHKIIISLTSSNDWSGGGVQRVGGTMVLYEDFVVEGYLNINKTSKCADITRNNDAYSLANAEYSIYRDYGCTQWVKSGKTNANGKITGIALDPGTYYVKETNAPYGYAIDNMVYPVTITANNTSTLDVQDYPQLDPVTVVLKKYDPEHSNKPLQGAEYTIKYYDQITDNPTGTPKRTWTVTTDEYGEAYIPDSELWKITYDDNSVQYGLPIGTLTFQETKAPDGYAIDDTIFIRKITSEGSAIDVHTFNAPNTPNKVQRAELKLFKRGLVLTGSEEVDGEYKPIYEEKGVAGAEYTVYAAEDITLPDGTVVIQKDEEVTKGKTDKNGNVTFKNLYIGDYYVKETEAPHGYLIDETTHNVTLTANAQVAVTPANIEVPEDRAKVRIDFKKMKEIFLGRTIFSYKFVEAEDDEFTFGIYAAEDIYNTPDGKEDVGADLIFAEGSRIATLTTKDGRVQFEDYLPYGQYSLIEDEAEGFLAQEVFMFDVVYGGDKEQFIDININDGEVKNKMVRPQMGSIEISYSDTQTLSGFLAPRTGDSSNMFMFMVITGLSGIGLFTCVILNEKFSKKKKTVTQEN